MPDDTAGRLWLHIHRKLPWSGVTHLILDQFEEIFTVETQRPGTEEEVREALGILIQGAVPQFVTRCLETEETFFDYFDPDSQPVRVILALRDDYVYALNRWRRYLSQLGQNYFELRPLSGTAAFDAVFRPGCLRARKRELSGTLIDADTGMPPIVTEATAKRIVRFVAGKKEDVPLEQIETVPPILSLLCRELNERRYQQPPRVIAPPAAEIVFDEQKTNVETILETFYERCLRDRPEVLEGVGVGWVKSLNKASKATPGRRNSPRRASRLRVRRLRQADEFERFSPERKPGNPLQAGGNLRTPGDVVLTPLSRQALGNIFAKLCRGLSIISGGFLLGNGFSHGSILFSFLGTVVGVAAFALNEAFIRREAS